MRLRPLLLILTAGVAAAACSGGGGGGGGGDDDDAATTPTPVPTPETALVVALDPTSLVITLSGSIAINATLTRLPGFEGTEFEFRLDDPPIAGISADPVTIGSGALFGVLTLYAAPTTAEGGPLPLGITFAPDDPLALDVTTQVMVTVSAGGL